MIDNDLIDSKGMMECIKDILPPIKTCLDDGKTNILYKRILYFIYFY